MKPIFLKCSPIERKYLLNGQLNKYLPPEYQINLPETYYLWNEGIEGWQQYPNGERQLTPNWLDYPPLCNTYLVEGILNPLSQANQYKILQLIDSQVEGQFIFIDTHLDIPQGLQSLVEIKQIPLPQGERLEKLLENLGHKDIESQTACLGLSYGEILGNITPDTTKEQIERIKYSKLSSKGLKLASKPDVPDIAGMDALKADLAEIKHRFHPTASKIGLHPPKGVMLWGVPGTGKSLTAKLAAKMIDALLIQCDWNLLLGETEAQTIDNLEYMLNLVDMLGKVVLFMDEGEKALAGSLKGGVATKMTGRLLGWLQDHETPVMLLMTINHLNLLPPEMFRRFEYIWFFSNDLHKGAMYDIFNLHLSASFANWQPNCLNDDEWEELFFTYTGYTPAEIASVVRVVQSTLFNRLMNQQLTESEILEAIADYPLRHPEQLYKELIAAYAQVKAAINIPLLQKQIEEIAMNQAFARPVMGADTSKFANTSEKQSLTLF
ncbi:MAG: ATP-binding protein [Microcystaceae cyanobacterium]